MRPEQEREIRLRLKKRYQHFPDVVNEFLYISETARSVSTVYEYAKDIQLFLDFLIEEGKVQVERSIDVTKADLGRLVERDFVDFLNYLTQYDRTYVTTKGKVISQRYTNSSEGKNRKLATLRVFFDYLFINRHVDRDVTKRIEMKITKRAKIKNRLTDDEVVRFFNTIKEDVNIESAHAKAYHEKTRFRDYVIAMLFAYLGIRVSELAQLDVDDIFKEEQALIIVRKGGNEQAIPIPDAIFEYVLEYLEVREQATNVMKDHEKALFLSMQGRRINPRTIRNMLEKYRQRSGLSIKITPHVFRRTFGTNHYNTFKDMYLTALILGHSSAETTRKYYADPNEERVKSSMAIFDYNQKK